MHKHAFAQMQANTCTWIMSKKSRLSVHTILQTLYSLRFLAKPWPYPGVKHVWLITRNSQASPWRPEDPARTCIFLPFLSLFPRPLYIGILEQTLQKLIAPHETLIQSIVLYTMSSLLSHLHYTIMESWYVVVENCVILAYCMQCSSLSTCTRTEQWSDYAGWMALWGHLLISVAWIHLWLKKFWSTFLTVVLTQSALERHAHCSTSNIHNMCAHIYLYAHMQLKAIKHINHVSC